MPFWSGYGPTGIGSPYCRHQRWVYLWPLYDGVDGRIHAHRSYQSNTRPASEYLLPIRGYLHGSLFRRERFEVRLFLADYLQSIVKQVAMHLGRAIGQHVFPRNPLFLNRSGGIGENRLNGNSTLLLQDQLSDIGKKIMVDCQTWLRHISLLHEVWSNCLHIMASWLV